MKNLLAVKFFFSKIYPKYSKIGQKYTFLTLKKTLDKDLFLGFSQLAKNKSQQNLQISPNLRFIPASDNTARFLIDGDI